ncbi:hypothetical protein XELAEV_18006037mg [Xenopus laevis]|uniref:Uncharacterized protein n=1 Tax=Xenopus laevis TaxID=8355 RepID=A0A974I3R5_XENLA|nr:hypothetical protein XELAEV_18006037mg [Xenopus laevis]
MLYCFCLGFHEFKTVVIVCWFCHGWVRVSHNPFAPPSSSESEWVGRRRDVGLRIVHRLSVRLVGVRRVTSDLVRHAAERCLVWTWLRISWTECGMRKVRGESKTMSPTFCNNTESIERTHSE